MNETLKGRCGSCLHHKKDGDGWWCRKEGGEYQNNETWYLHGCIDWEDKTKGGQSNENS